MRDRVVRVNDVQAPLARDLNDRVRERQDVLRLTKQRVARREHLMEGQARLELVSERRFRADQVHLMPASRERFSELGGDDPASAHRRIADHADVHWMSHSREPSAGSSRVFITKPGPA